MIEQAIKPPRRKWYLWRELDETTREAMERHKAAHPEAKKTDEFILFYWQNDESGDVADQGARDQR